MDSRIDDIEKTPDPALDFSTRLVDSAGWFMFAAFLARPAIESLLRRDDLATGVLNGTTCLALLAAGIASLVGERDRSFDPKSDGQAKTANAARRLTVRIPDGVVWLFGAAFLARPAIDSFLRRDDLAAGVLSGIALLALLLAGILSLTRRTT